MRSPGFGPSMCKAPLPRALTFHSDRGPGCNLSRTLILHIPLFSGGRGEEDKEGKVHFAVRTKLLLQAPGKEMGYRNYPAPEPLGPG